MLVYLFLLLAGCTLLLVFRSADSWLWVSGPAGATSGGALLFSYCCCWSMCSGPAGATRGAALLFSYACCWSITALVVLLLISRRTSKERSNSLLHNCSAPASCGQVQPHARSDGRNDSTTAVQVKSWCHCQCSRRGDLSFSC